MDKKLGISLLLVGLVAGLWLMFDRTSDESGLEMFEAGGGIMGEEKQQLSEKEEYWANLPEDYRRMTVPYLRQVEYPGSEIVIEREVGDYPTYTSYVASYQSEGLKVYGLLTRPKGEAGEKFPAVVFMHGYIPPQSYVTTEKYEAYVDYLARSGLVVFKIDFRGNGESEGEASGAYFSGDYVVDALNAYESLRRLEYVDENKVGLWGHSMSGNVVLRAMVVRPEIPAAVIWAGAVYTYGDMAEYGISDSSYRPGQNPHRPRRADFFETVGERGSETPFWQMTAATNYVDELEGRIELHHATKDPVVNVEYSRGLAEILEAAGVEYKLYEYDSGGHNLSSPAFGPAMRRTVEWLKG